MKTSESDLPPSNWEVNSIMDSFENDTCRWWWARNLNREGQPPTQIDMKPL